MNLVGQAVAIMSSTDPTQAGRTGDVVLETAGTLLLRSGSRTVTVPKLGSVLLLRASGGIVNCGEIMGRLEERMRVRKP
jgi:RNase P/RNase MRP subunit p29